MHSIIFRLACCRPVVADRSKAGICSHVSCGRFYYYSVYICLRERERERVFLTNHVKNNSFFCSYEQW